MGGAPVGRDESFETEFFAQNLDQRIGITAGVSAIHFVVRAHDGGNISANRIDKRSNVDFVECLLIDHDVGGSRVIGDIVLGLSHDALLLNAFDQTGSHDAR